MDKILGLGIVLTAKNMMGGAFQSATGQVGSFGESADIAKAKFVGLSTAAYAGGKALTGSILSTYDAYADVAKAQGEIASLGIDDSGIESITKSATKFSNQWAGTTAPEFIKASYDIKSGIETLSNAAVGEFTSLAALTGTATKSTTGQMTSLFASGYGIYRDQFGSFGESTIAGWKNMSNEEKDIEFGKYFSAGIASSVQKFKTDGGNMSAAISNLGATGTKAGVEFAEQLTILGTLQKTMSGSEAATKYKSFLNTAAGAGDKLGLSLTDANNQLLSTPEILDQLQDKYGDTLDAVEKQELKKAFGTDEAMAMIDLLYGKTGDLRNSITGMNDSLSQGERKATEMAKAAQKGREFERLGQQFGNLSAIIGESFAPAVLWVTDKVSSLIQWIGDLSNENRAILGGIALFVATLAGLATAFGAVGIIASGIITIAPAIGAAFTIITGPIGILVAAIGFLAYQIWSAWDTIEWAFNAMVDTAKQAWEALVTWTGLAMDAVANAISNAISGIWEGIKFLFSWSPVGMIIENWDPMLEWINNKVGWVGDAVSGVWDGMKSIFSWSPLGMIIESWEPMLKWVSDKLGWLSSMASGVSGIFGFGDEEQTDTIKSDQTVADPDKPKDVLTRSQLNKPPVAVLGFEQPKKPQAVALGFNQPQKMLKTKQPLQAKGSPQMAGNTTNSIKIEVNNPSSEIDVERAVRRAISENEQSRRNRSYSDEEI